MLKHIKGIMTFCVEFVENIAGCVAGACVKTLAIVGRVLGDLLVIITLPLWYIPFKIIMKVSENNAKKKN